MVIETERLIRSEFHDSDAAGTYELNLHPEALRYTGRFVGGVYTLWNDDTTGGTT